MNRTGIILLALALLTVMVPPALAGTLNTPPVADAGPDRMIRDGGPDDLDGAEDGKATFRLDGSQSHDPDSEANTQIFCDLDDQLSGDGLTEDGITDWRWYDGLDPDPETDIPISTGPRSGEISRGPGQHNFTLFVWDRCDETGKDNVTVWVDESKQILHTWDFEGLNPTQNWTLTSQWHVTDECGTDDYVLGFTQDPDLLEGREECSFDEGSESVPQGTATISFDPLGWYVVGIEYTESWEIQKQDTVEPEDIMRVEFSPDGGGSWILLEERNNNNAENRSDPTINAHSIDLREVGWDGEDVLFRFTFDAATAGDNDHTGWLIDDVDIIGAVENLPPTFSTFGTDFCNIRYNPNEARCGLAVDGPVDPDGNITTVEWHWDDGTVDEIPFDEHERDNHNPDEIESLIHDYGYGVDATFRPWVELIDDGGMRTVIDATMIEWMYWDFDATWEWVFDGDADWVEDDDPDACLDSGLSSPTYFAFATSRDSGSCSYEKETAHNSTITMDEFDTIDTSIYEDLGDGIRGNYAFFVGVKEESVGDDELVFEVRVNEEVDATGDALWNAETEILTGNLPDKKWRNEHIWRHGEWDDTDQDNGEENGFAEELQVRFRLQVFDEDPGDVGFWLDDLVFVGITDNV